MLQDFAVRKMFPQTCMPFAPFEKSPCRPAKHFRRPKKVSAGVYAFQNIRGKFPQPSTPFPRPGSFLFSGSPLSSRADSAAAVRQSTPSQSAACCGCPRADWHLCARKTPVHTGRCYPDAWNRYSITPFPQFLDPLGMGNRVHFSYAYP